LAAGGGLGIVGLIAVFLISHFFNADPNKVAGVMESLSGSTPVQSEYAGSAEEEELAQMVRVTLGWTEQVWAKVYPQFATKYGARVQQYRPTKLVLFTGSTATQCGKGSAASGPFYCPADQQVYIDLSFYKQLRDEMGAPGDFAQAYVIAHEVGHHVQNLMGLLTQVQRQKSQVSKTEANQLQVRTELMADYLAGIWSFHVNEAGMLDKGDVEEAVNAANQIGDDTLQRNAGRTVRPHTFTHGTSAQRKRWYARGWEAASEGRYTKYDAFDGDYSRL